MKKDNIVRFGIIGCGFRGTAYSDYTLSHPEEAVVTCACDILPVG